jgi:membrane-associated phospholipid phosphatase
MPESELWQPQLIPALRAHEVHVIDLTRLRGLVSAPSFHAAAATLYIAYGWTIPRLRWPVLGMNAAMLLATPVEGTHYLTDILLGIAVAVVAIAVATLRAVPQERHSQAEGHGLGPSPGACPAQ